MTEEEFNIKVVGMHRQLYAYAYTLLHDEDEASDCVQEAYVKLWEFRRRLSEIENPEAYCITVARRQALDRLRRKRLVSDESADERTDIVSADATPAELTEIRDEMSFAKAMLCKLPERQRNVVELSGIAGLSNSEIAEATGLSDDNVRVLLSRGRSRLRQLFNKR